MELKTNIFCKGKECPVKNTCLRYTQRNKTTQCIGGYTLINKCSLQKRYLRDTSNVNESIIKR